MSLEIRDSTVPWILRHGVLNQLMTESNNIIDCVLTRASSKVVFVRLTTRLFFGIMYGESVNRQNLFNSSFIKRKKWCWVSRFSYL